VTSGYSNDYSTLYKSPEGYAALMANYDAHLAWLGATTPYESITVNTRFGFTHVLITGPKDAPPLVLLPSPFIGMAVGWKRYISRFSKEYRVYAFDLIGGIGKSAPTRLAYNTLDYAIWLLDVIYALNLGPAGYIGTLTGCWLLLKLATLAPSQIAKAVLVAPIGLLSLTPSKSFRAKLYAILAQFFPTRKTITRSLRENIAPASMLTQEIFREAVEILLLCYKYYKFPAVPKPLSEFEQARLTAPTLLLDGEYNALYKPQELVAQARRVLPNLRAAEIVPNAGSAILDEQPAWATERILRFLREGN